MIKTIILTILAVTLSPTAILAQPSLIGRIMETREAVVSIEAQNANIVKAPQAGTAIDPATGQLITMRRLAVGSYARVGAGVLIHPDGIIITNAHTGNKADIIRVTLQTGETFLATPISVINGLDLLFLKIEAGRPLPFVRIANSDHIRLGQEIVTIGHSAFLKNTITGGTISGLGVNRKLKHAGTHRTDLIQTTINLYQGDSGGPLFNQEGDLIGLMTADEGSTDHSSFAIPSNKIYEYLIQYLKSNNPSP